MAKASRDKGLRGEREVTLAFRAAGYEVKNLDGGGDQLVVCGVMPLHLEVKRQENLRMDAWSAQAEAEAPLGAAPVVVYRRSREPWRASLLLEDLIRLLP